MKKITFEILNATFSESRLLPYRKAEDAPRHVLEKYHGNLIIGQSMMPCLHYFEICLRNHIDTALRMYYTQTWLLEPPQHLNISEQDMKKIHQIKSKVQKENRRKATHDDIVAQMSFGFWCSFLQKKYDPIIWHKKNAFKIVFPNIERANRTRKHVEKLVLQIKEIRNRIAHHEPVWKNRTPIVETHQICCHLIKAMSLDAVNLLHKIDRFQEEWKKISSVYYDVEPTPTPK